MLDDQKELFIVVDKDDNILEYRTRYDCHHNNSLIHRAIHIIIYNHQGDILLQKRNMHKDLNPGKYTLSVGGHVTKGQTYEEAARREMQEELGIDIPIKFVKKFVDRNNQESEMRMVFEGKYNGPFFPAFDEVEQVEFVPVNNINDMKNLLTSNAQKSLLEIGLLS